MKKNNDYFNLQQNITFLSILILILLNQAFNSFDFFIFTIIWVILILIMGNIRRIKKTNLLNKFIRMTFYFLPFIFPSLLFQKFALHVNKKIILFIFIAFFIGILVYILKRKEWRFFFDNYNLAITIKRCKQDYLLRVYNLIGAAICEELFFRKYILSIDNVPYVSLLIIS